MEIWVEIVAGLRLHNKLLIKNSGLTIIRKIFTTCASGLQNRTGSAFLCARAVAFPPWAPPCPAAPCRGTFPGSEQLTNFSGENSEPGVETQGFQPKSLSVPCTLVRSCTW